MTIEKFEKFVKDNNLVIRAIPERVRSAYDVNEHNMKKFIGAEKKFLPEYKREMLVFYTEPSHAGEFLVIRCNNTMSNVDFSGGMYFKNIQSIVEYYSAVKEDNE